MRFSHFKFPAEQRDKVYESLPDGAEPESHTNGEAWGIPILSIFRQLTDYFAHRSGVSSVSTEEKKRGLAILNPRQRFSPMLPSQGIWDKPPCKLWNEDVDHIPLSPPNRRRESPGSFSHVRFQ